MKKPFILFFILMMAVSPLLAMGNFRVSFTPEGESVPLSRTKILTDPKDDKLVRKAVDMFTHDFAMVTGNSLGVIHKNKGGDLIVFGTIGSAHIKALSRKGLIDLSPIENGFEQFIVRTLPAREKGKGNLVVIVGSDPRGAAYGLLTLSRKMGVSPWYWWADVPVEHHDEVYLNADYISSRPSIRYRGVFINDEDWGLFEWAARNFEPETGSIGPKTYRQVCDLLLRLRCNMLAPAMHLCSHTFYSHPENKEIADEYGIMITTSHCEPLLFNNLSSYEWRSEVDGPWDYGTNRQTICRKLEERVKEASRFENIYTMGLRGLHDEGMRGNYSMPERVKLLEQAVDDQRQILARHIDAPIDSIPQILVPYKEVQQIYENGMQVPEHITLVWPDDNYGYMKMLSNSREQQRSGRSGIYYHISYLGVPHDYLWLSTTPPALMYEELKKAYDTGADRYWLLNVGDIKPMELSIQMFADMAWDFKSFNYDNANNYQAEFLAGILGKKYLPQLQFLLDEYYRLAWSRKPEHMGWEREWDSPEFTGMKSTEFSFENYNDAQKRLADYSAISEVAARILDELPQAQQPMFFEMLGYPVMASALMNDKFLLAQLNQEVALNGEFGKANWAGEKAQKAFRDLQELTRRYNRLLDGKWDHMMQIPKGVCALYQNMPHVSIVQDAPQKIDLTPKTENYRLDSCLYIPVNSFSEVKASDSHSFRLIKGLGYDWEVVQMGEVTQPEANPSDINDFSISYTLPKIDADSIKVILYTVPRFPVYKGASTAFGISVDRSAPEIINYLPVEQSRQWKDNVIRNAMVSEASFRINPDAPDHRLTITCGAPGLLIQRILVDWGGLRPTYVGPSAPLEKFTSQK